MGCKNLSGDFVQFYRGKGAQLEKAKSSFLHGMYNFLE